MTFRGKMKITLNDLTIVDHQSFWMLSQVHQCLLSSRKNIYPKLGVGEACQRLSSKSVLGDRPSDLLPQIALHLNPLLINLIIFDFRSSNLTFIKSLMSFQISLYQRITLTYHVCEIKGRFCVRYLRGTSMTDRHPV